MGKRRSVGMRIDHPSDIFGRPGQLVKISVVFRERDLFSTEGYGKYQAQTREGVWVVSLFFLFFYFCKGMIVDRDKTNSDQGKGFDRYAGRV